MCPENVTRLRTIFFQCKQSVLHALCHSTECWLRGNPNETRFGDRTGSPLFRPMLAQPAADGFMVYMLGPNHGDQHIHVQQEDTHGLRKFFAYSMSSASKARWTSSGVIFGVSEGTSKTQ